MLDVLIICGLALIPVWIGWSAGCAMERKRGLRAAEAAARLAREEGLVSGIKQGAALGERDLESACLRHTRFGVRHGFREALEMVNKLNRDYLAGVGPWYPGFYMEPSPDDETPTMPWGAKSVAGTAAEGFSAADRHLLKGMKIRLDDDAR